MASNPDPLTLRIAAAMVQRQQQQTTSGVDARDLRQAPTGGIGALRDLFKAVARPDELEPRCLVVGLDCSDPDVQAFRRDSDTATRDALAIYGDHVLLVGNPMRGAGIGGMLKLLGGSFSKRGKERNTPHSRIDQTNMRQVELAKGRPPWDTDREQFVHIGTGEREIWFWMDLAIDSEDDVRRAIDEMATGNARA